MGSLDDELKEKGELIKKQQAELMQEAGEGLQIRLALYEELESNKEFIQEQANPLAKEIMLQVDRYKERLKEVEAEAKKNGIDFDINDMKDINTDKLAAYIMGGGAIAGGATAAFGPSIAMIIAMNFGVAQGGAAIAGLSGVAASNAALAWLGGGALAAGGGGMAGGQALLAILGGPVGWAIAGGAGLTALGMKLYGDKKKNETLEAYGKALCQLSILKSAEQTTVYQANYLYEALQKDSPLFEKLFNLYQASLLLNVTLEDINKEATW